MLLMKQSEYEEEDEGVVETSPDGNFVRYDEVLGTGAFKVVYKGFDRENRIKVAWYQISIDDKALDSPELEESLLADESLLESIKHSNIIKYRSSWVDDVNNNINVITELFSSRTLRHYRKNHTYVDIKAVKKFGRQILEGLQYLHGQDPPVIHKELRCDNIFVNWNGGEVKIGDLGLAAIINRASAKSVRGSSEFMAPELYDDEEHNELVDINSFGMCMLELVTCECPYSECKHQARIFKEVTAGVKPLALGKVKVPEIKELIEKCLAPASRRLSAAELLKDPFFSVEHLLLPKSTEVCTSSAPCQHNVSEKTASESTLKSSFVSTKEIKMSLKTKRMDTKSIEFDLQISCLGSSVANRFEFAFDLEADDALQIAVELVRDKSLSFRHLPLAVELMDNMLLELVPGWTPCYG